MGQPTPMEILPYQSPSTNRQRKVRWWFKWLLVPAGLFVTLVLTDLSCEHMFAAAAPGPIEVQVRVVDDQTHAPIPNASILSSWIGRPVSTDSIGVATVQAHVFGDTAWGFFHRRGYYFALPIEIHASGYEDSAITIPRQKTLTVLGIGTAVPKVQVNVPLSRRSTTQPH